MPVPGPASEEHKKLRNLIRKQMQLSEELLSSRHDAWKRSERTYRLFVAPEEVQKPTERVTDEDELLFWTPSAIVVPLSYAIVQTVVSFWVSLFTAQPPYMKVGGLNPESTSAAKAQELLLSFQLDRTRYILWLHQWLLDSCKYGVGIVKSLWEVTHRMQTIQSSISVPTMDGTLDFPIRERREVLEYEGNVIENLDPYEFRPDPRVPIADFQRGSFCGQATYRSFFYLLRKQREGIYQNVRDIPAMTNESMKQFDQSERDRVMGYARRFGFTGDKFALGKDFMVLLEEVVTDLIPKEHGLSESEDVERWVIALANRSTIIRGELYDNDHGEFPYNVVESSPDKHSILNPGTMEIMEPIAQHISWLYNSHLQNVRKALNDMFIVDPMRLNLDDLLNPQPGKFIRLSDAYAGSGVDGAMKQFEVVDITSQHLSTAAALIDMLERSSAASDALQGRVEDKRRTATEVSAAAQQGAQRLRTLARLISAQGHVPLARQLVQNNQQFLSQEVYLKVLGSLAGQYRGVGRLQGDFLAISPQDVQGIFDFPINDGSAPLDPVRFAETWLQFAMTTVQHPVWSQITNHEEVLRQFVYSLGLQNVADLILPQEARVMPDQALAQQLQAGNLVPTPGAEGGIRGRANGQAQIAGGFATTRGALSPQRQ